MSCCIQCCCIYPLALRAIPATALGRACGIIDPRERDGGRQAAVASLAGCGLVCGPVFVGGSITQYPDGVILGPSWAILGPSWGHLGAILGHLGAILGHLGPSWGHLGPSWGYLGAIFGPCWAHLGPSWANLGPFWAHLGPSWVILGLY